MQSQAIHDTMLYIGLPISLVVFATGLWKKHPYGGFLIGCVPLLLLWALLLPDLLTAGCPAPCEEPDVSLAMLAGASLLHVIFYAGITSFMVLVIHFLIDPATALIQVAWQKVVILLQMGFLGLVGVALAFLNQEYVNLAVLMVGTAVLEVASNTWLLVSGIIILVMAAGLLVGYNFYRKTAP
jgi:hypothetical protein